MAKHNGFEPVDDKPVAVPVKFRSPPGEVDRLRTLMANLVVDMRGRNDVESFEESFDFEVEDDEDVVSLSEQRYMQEERLLTEAEEAVKVATQRRDAAELRRKYAKQNRNLDGDRSGKVDAKSDGAPSAESGDKRSGEKGLSGASDGNRVAPEKAGGNVS